MRIYIFFIKDFIIQKRKIYAFNKEKEISSLVWWQRKAACQVKLFKHRVPTEFLKLVFLVDSRHTLWQQLFSPEIMNTILSKV